MIYLMLVFVLDFYLSALLMMRKKFWELARLYTIVYFLSLLVVSWLTGIVRFERIERWELCDFDVILWVFATLAFTDITLRLGSWTLERISGRNMEE